MIIIAKQRKGRIGEVNLTFRGQYTRFDNYAYDDMAQAQLPCLYLDSLPCMESRYQAYIQDMVLDHFLENWFQVWYIFSLLKTKKGIHYYQSIE